MRYGTVEPLIVTSYKADGKPFEPKVTVQEPNKVVSYKADGSQFKPKEETVQQKPPSQQRRTKRNIPKFENTAFVEP